VQINRVRHLLAFGPEDDPAVKAEAWKEFHRLMHMQSVLSNGDQSQVQFVLEQYMQWVQRCRATNTFKKSRNFIQNFVEMFGHIRVCDLKLSHVEEWLQAGMQLRRHEKAKKWCRWGPSSRRIAIGVLVGALRWAVKQGILTRNPLPPIERPPAVSRAGTCIITDDMHRLLLRCAEQRRRKGYRDYLVALYETGARPSEIACLEARHYRKTRTYACWVIEPNDPGPGANKLAYLGRRRVIYLSETLQEMVEELNRLHPTGPIFPNESGLHFTLAALEVRFQNFRKRINREAEKNGLPRPFPPGVSLYGYRHRFVTDWLEAGKPVGHLAELLGTSMAMIQKHYSHLTERSQAISDQLKSFSRGTGESTFPASPGPT
jgi:integrase